jgi:hypothetical protein
VLLARRFFQDSASDFAGRLKGYWKGWRTQAEPEPRDEPRLALA